VGRFAPTPSGDLHLGSLYAAAASYLDARAHHGQWLLRIEDLDRPREVAGAAQRMLRALEEFGFEWDGAVTYQHMHIERYAAALIYLHSRGLTFACHCTRAQLEDGVRYPGTCRDAGHTLSASAGQRLRVEAGSIMFTDRIQGMFRQDVAGALGDPILKRRDQIIAYLLAVVVDDAAQGITHVVRGADLLDSTPRQIYLQSALQLRTPRYAHVPVLSEDSGAKLAKSRRSLALASHEKLPQLLSVFSLLGLRHEVAQVSTVHDAWRWAIANWHVNNVPKCLNLRVTL
jgi:glutamyl-Q tRNA(Asp) synthetase